jgi:hypothetical protein
MHRQNLHRGSKILDSFPLLRVGAVEHDGRERGEGRERGRGPLVERANVVNGEAVVAARKKNQATNGKLDMRREHTKRRDRKRS